MKLRIKKLSIVCIALVGLFFSACEKQEIENNTKVENKNKFIDNDYLKTLQEDSFFAGAINDFNNFVSYEKSSSSNNFKIVEGSVRIERGVDYTTYVLLLENQTNKKNYFENLVIQTALNKPTRYLLFKYDLQKSFNNQFIEDPEHGLFPNMKISQLNVVSNSSTLVSNKGGCAIVEIAFCSWGGTEHLAGGGCTNTYSYSFEICTGGGVVDVPMSGFPTLPTTNNNPDPTGPGTYTPPTVEVPDYGTTTYFPPTMIIDENGDLIFDPYAFDSEQTGFLNGNPLIRTQITNYLLNHITINDRIFIKQAIDKMRQNPGLYTNLNPFLIEKNIDASALPPCAQNIVNNVKNIAENDFAKIIAKLGGSNSPYTVNIIPVPQSSLNSTNTNGLTHATSSWTQTSTGLPIDNSYTINISESFLSSATQLSIASVIMHEFVHCYFMSLIDIATATNASTITSYPGLWESFNNVGSPPQAEHDIIVKKFRTTLASSLQEYNTGIAVGNNAPQQIYMDLAMMGLTGTQTFTNFLAIEKNRINATIAAEVNSVPTTSNLYASGNAVTAYPISQPCN